MSGGGIALSVRRCSGAAAALLQLHAGLPALAQDELPGAGEPVEEIVVVGSHLPRARIDGPAPVDVFDAESLQSSGVNTLADFARHLTYNLGVPNDENAALSSAPGTSFFNLRGIGAPGTLTLVNGRRVAPHGAPQANGQTFVDLNSIPFAAIERIEVLKDGASALYGSEAVAGVVNVVLKQQHDGLSMSAGWLTTTRDDASEATLDLLWGTPLPAGDLVVGASWLRREPMWSRDRAWLSDMNLRDVGGFNNRTSFSSPMTAFLVQTGRARAEPACPAEPEHPLAFVHPIRQPNPRLDSLCTMNQKLFTQSIPESDRLGLTGTLRHELNETTMLFAELFANRTKTALQLPPPVTDKTPAPVLPFFPLPFVAADHPGNPFAEPVAISYSVLDAGPTTHEVDALASRVTAGAEGRAGSWRWRTSVLASASDVDTEDRNLVDSAAFQEALLGRGGPNGDQYYDPFGFGPQNPPEVIAAFQVPVSRRSERFRERAFDLEAIRSLRELPGGSAALAVGYQYRDQRADAHGDELQVSGRAFGMHLLRPLTAERQVNSIYAELGLPLTSALELQLAARYERYSDFGSSTDPKIALRWQVTDGVALRGSVGTSFRAPTFTELFATPRERLAFLVDTARCEVTGAPVDCVPFPYRTTSGGNAELEPETGRSEFFGVVWSPQRLPGLELGIDAWRFEHEQRIVEVSPQFVVDELGADPELVVRGPSLPGDPPGTPGPILLVNARTLNVERLETRGVDVTLGYALSTARYGEFRLDAALGYLDEYRFTAGPDAALVDLELAGRAEIFPLPRVRGNLALGWLGAEQRITAVLHHVGSYRSPVNLVVDDQETETPFEIDGHLTLDLQYERAFGRLGGGTLRLGCRNCLDEPPPTYNYTWTGEALHDPRGAILYVRWIQPLRAD